MFACDYCEYRVASSKIMDIHNSTFHSKDPKFSCDNCGYQHSANQESCPAFGNDCRKCGLKNYFAAKCKRNIEETDTLAEETYQTEEVSSVKLDNAQLVTHRLESGQFFRSQPDTGAQYNVLPLHVYKQTTTDNRLEKVNPFRRLW